MLDVKFPFNATLCPLRFVDVNVTPPVPIQFVIPRVEDKISEMINESGFVYKRVKVWKIKILI